MSTPSQAQLRTLMRKAADAPAASTTAMQIRDSSGRMQCKICALSSAAASTDAGDLSKAGAWEIHVRSRQHAAAVDALRSLRDDGKSLPARSASAVGAGPASAPEPSLRPTIPVTLPQRAANPTAAGTKAAPSAGSSQAHSMHASLPTSEKETTAAPARPAAANEFAHVSLSTALHTKPRAELDKAKSAAAPTDVPSGFFDDPLEEAMSRNIDPKLVLKAAAEEEWDEFQEFARGVIAEGKAEAQAEEVRYTSEREVEGKLEGVMYTARMDVLRHLRDQKRAAPDSHVIADDDEELDPSVEGSELVSGISFITGHKSSGKGVTAREMATLVSAKAAARSHACPPPPKRPRIEAATATSGAGDVEEASSENDSESESSEADLDALLDWRRKRL